MPTSQQLYQFWQMGDVNQDGYIDSKDLDLIAASLGTYNPACDLNQDHVVDSADLQIAASNIGKNIWDYFGIPRPIDLPTILMVGLAAVGGLSLIVYALSRARKKKP